MEYKDKFELLRTMINNEKSFWTSWENYVADKEYYNAMMDTYEKVLSFMETIDEYLNE